MVWTGSQWTIVSGGSGSTVLSETTPSAPTSGVALYSTAIANARLPAAVGPDGLVSLLGSQLTLGRRVNYLRSAPGGGALTGIGLPSPGMNNVTLYARTPAVTAATRTALTASSRLGLGTTTSTAGSVAYLTWGSASYKAYYVGSGNGLCGFICRIRFGISDPATVTGARGFWGMANATGFANVEPNTQTNCIGIAQLSTSNNMCIVWGGSTAQTHIDLGANFPAGTLSAGLYDLILYAPNSSSDTVYYEVRRYTTSGVPAYTATGTLTGTAGVAIPSTSTGLMPAFWRSNNTTALQVAWDHVDLTVEDGSL